MRFRLLGLLAVLTLSATACSGLRFDDRSLEEAGFRLSEVVDALAYGSIPPVDDPRHVPFGDVQPDDAEPLAVIRVGDQVRAYPLSILVWHEVVNDSIGGVPVLIAYSPLTDSVTAWVRRDRDRTYSFAASGKVFAAAGLLADRETGSLWLSATGRAVAGPAKGAELAAVPVLLVSAIRYGILHPDGTVMDPETGFSRPYGRSPYQGYAARAAPPPRLFLRRADDRLPPMTHVLAVPGDPVYPFKAIRDEGVINDDGVVVFWFDRVASAIDREVIAESRDTGSAMAYLSEVNGRRLTFRRDGRDRFVDNQTHSVWDAAGRAVTGPLSGTALRPLAGVRSLWFAWAATHPGAQVYARTPGG